ncbi:GIY-YIG nuclease family protein [Herbaspirillum chlorophenolicum]|uniref:GIY-YIG nuclease family protein n=1 Tax=Herbaspirillum chlorophenolicum TaxID=211589 RepID=A0ABW8F0H1_9BURK
MPANRTLSESLLSKITLARFLELSAKRFQQYVAELEQSQDFIALRPFISIDALPGTRFLDGTGQGRATHLLNLRRDSDQLGFQYQSCYFTRQYALKDGAPPADWPGPVRRLWHRLRLVNTRNLLTHALIQVVVHAQRKYLLSNDIADLVQYTQQAAADDMARLPDTQGIVCEASRISRLACHLCLLTGEGQGIPLARLFVNSRQRNQYLLDSLIKAEALSLFQGYRGKLLTDDDLAVILNNVHQLGISRRSITNARHSLAIPDHRERHKHMPYVAATSGFSRLRPLRLELLDCSIPAKAGVYEIRLRDTEPLKDPLTVLPSHNPILYIGSSLNLKKRLREHLTGNSNNNELYEQLSQGNAEVRFKLYEAPRWIERNLYQTFVETFGASPSCNRISP